MAVHLSEHDRAREWRLSKGLSKTALGALTGYNRTTIYWFERGLVPPRKGHPRKAISPEVWLRYKRACAGAFLDFNWGD